MVYTYLEPTLKEEKEKALDKARKERASSAAELARDKWHQGECRWKAAKMAGLKEVPVKMLGKIGPMERYIRQVQENIHQNTMTAWDTAEALEKVRKERTNSAAEFVRDKKHQGSYFKRGVKELHELFGIPESRISSLLDLLKETGPTKKALQTQDSK